jgi:type IV secretory pathway VirB10-like protein
MSTENQNGQDRAPKADYIDGVDGVNGRPVTQKERSYRDGYVEGQSKTKGTQYERERAAETNGLASGVVIGSVLAFAVGLGFAVWAYANRDLPSTEQPSSINPVTVPASPAASVAPTAPAKQTTIIERTIEKPAPPPAVRVIEVPRAAPSPAAPSTTPERPASEQTTPTAPANSAPATTDQAPASPSVSPESNPSDRTAPDSIASPNSQQGR